MSGGEKIIEKIDDNKPVVWGIFLSALIPGAAVSNILLFALLALSFITIWFRRKIIFKKSFIPVLILFVWGVVSVLWTTHLPTTLSGIEISLGLLIIPFVVSQQSDFTKKDIAKLINIFSVSLIVYFVVSLGIAAFRFVEDGQVNHFFYHDLTSLFKNNAIYISLFVSICILAKASFRQKSRYDRIIIVVLSVFLLFLSSKNLIITTFLLLGLSFVFYRKHQKTPARSFVLISAVMLLSVVVFITFDNPVKQRFLDESELRNHEIWNRQDFSDFEFNGSNIRVFMWRVVGEMIENDQIGYLGLGLNNIDYLTDQYFQYYNLYQGYIFMNFHNQYLQVLGELGFVGLALFVFVLLFFLYRALRSKNKQLLIITTLFIIAFMTESYLTRQKGIMIFSAVFCLFLSTRPTAKN